MARGVKAIFDFLIFSNIFLSLCVTSLVIETSLILYGIIRDYKYPFFLFSATLLLYCFHRIYRFNFRSHKEKLSGRHRWVQDHLLTFYVVMTLAAAGVLFSLVYFVPWRVLFWLAPVAAISIGYTIPCIPWKERYLRLRDIPGIKILLICVVLGLTTVLLPVLAYSDSSVLLQPRIMLIFLRRIFFIFAITIPFDIRDIDYDKAINTLSFPVLFGPDKSRVLAYFALFIFSALAITQYFLIPGTKLSYCIALLISAIPSAAIIRVSGKGQGDVFYSVYLEGMMLLQCLLIIGANITGR